MAREFRHELDALNGIYAELVKLNENIEKMQAPPEVVEEPKAERKKPGPKPRGVAS